MSTAILEAGPFRPDRVKDSAWRERLRRAGFTAGAVSEVLEGRNDRKIDVQCALRRTAEASPFNLLVRTFILGMPVTEEAVRRALSPVDVEWLIEVGLIKEGDAGMRAVARLLPWRDLIVLAFLSRCNGKRALRELIAEIAAEAGVDCATATATGLPLVRRLLRAGFLSHGGRSGVAGTA